jgi:hypothetical protein
MNSKNINHTSEDLSHENITRRGFLKKALAVSTAAALGTALPVAKSVDAKQPAEKSLFNMRPLGKTGLKVSSLGMGQAMEPSVYLHAWDRGMNFIETARGYRGGSHEEVVGEALKKIGRKNVVIMTKIDSDIMKREGRYRGILKSLDESLEALGVGDVDILLGHGIDEAAFLADAEVKKAFAELKKKGRIKFCGISTHKATPVLEWMIQNSFYDVAMVGFNFASPPEASHLLLKARKAGIGIITMKTLAFNVNDRDKAIPAAIRYAVSRSFVDSSVVLMADFERVEDNLKALKHSFTKNDSDLLKKNVRPSRSFF